MADRFPLIIDTNDGNKIKELPAGDNLDLSQSNIVNVAGITTLGTINAGSLVVNGSTLSTVALSNDYRDLDNVPITFSGDYTDLTNKPNIPTNLSDLSNVSLTQPTDGQGLVFDAADNQWKPSDINDLDLSNNNITDLSDVIITGSVENKYLKNYAGAWRPANITYSEILNRPTRLSDLDNDRFFITIDDVREEIENGTGNLKGSVFADDSSIMVDGVANRLNATGLFINGDADITGVVNLGSINSYDNVSPIPLLTGAAIGNTIITSGNIDSVDGLNIISTAGDLIISGIGLSISDPGGGTTIEDATQLSIAGSVDFSNATVSGLSLGDSVGNFSFANSTMTTDDSSSITVVPAVVMNSDLTVQNDLVVDGNITSTAAGDPEIVSETDILLTAVDRVTISQSPLKMASFTTAERDALTAENGDTIYNTTTNKFQGYANGTWVDLH